MTPITNSRELDKILTSRLLTPVYQPIVDLNAATGIGYEALIRGPVNSSLHSPLALFQTASETDRLLELEYASREISCQCFSELKGEGKLFINVSPMVLTSKGFRRGLTRSILERFSLRPDQIVIELSEQYPLDDYALIKKATLHYRSMGFEIAIDDLGAGYAGLRIWNEIRPDYVKIDRHFIEHIDKDLAKQEFVRSIQKIAERLSCKVIAEGIENLAELKTVKELGIALGQGYYLARPECYLNYRLPTEFKDLNKPVAKRIDKRTAGDFAHEASTVTTATSFESLVEQFRHDKHLDCLPVVSDNYVVGNVFRSDLLELMAWSSSINPYRKKKASDFMSTSAVIVDRHTSLEDVAKRLAAQDEFEVASHFIVTEDGRYYGVGQTRQLLKTLSETQLFNSYNESQFTKLPGNLVIDKAMNSRVDSGNKFYVA